jgi:hypothetical protein
LICDVSGTQSHNGTTYNLVAADDWARGATDDTTYGNIEDLTGTLNFKIGASIQNSKY